MTNLMIAALAIYRVAHMIAYEDGPFDIFLQLRDRAMVRFGRYHWITNGVHCPLCVSFWLSWFVPLSPHWLLIGLAIASIALILHTIKSAIDRVAPDLEQPS